MAANTEREYHVVVGYDGTDHCDLAVRTALREADDRDGVVHVLEVLPGKTSFAEAEEMQQQAEKVVQSFVKEVGVDQHRVLIHTRIGMPAKELVRLADETDADLVVVGTHGRKGVSRLVLGSVAEQTLRNAHCPVLVVRPIEHRAAAEGTDPALQPEPPCPNCVKKRFESKGAEWWCEAHASQQPHPRSIVGGSQRPSMGDWSRYNR